MSVYDASNLMENIRTALSAAGKNPNAPATADLNGFDEFHTGGHAATQHLLGFLKIKPTMRVLDIGCGIGGAARFVARQGAHVTGVDLSPQYIAAATELSAMTNTTANTTFKFGDATSLPFDDGTFDAAWTIHASMNVLDKAAMYREAKRVLKPGSMFGIYDIMRDQYGKGTFTYPVPWASNPGQSFLATAAETEVNLRNAGFEILRREDRHSFVVAVLGRTVDGPEHPLGRQLVMGANHVEKVRNLKYNIENNLCSPWVFICKA